MLSSYDLHYIRKLTCIFTFQPSRPPSVIPYTRHLEGKRKLAESLRLQTSNSVPDVPLLNFTPPDTPRYGVHDKIPLNAHLVSSCDDLYLIVPILVCSLIHTHTLTHSYTASRSVTSADQTSLDRSERASLDSKGSTEASVASGENAPGEVAVGNLIDITGELV